MAYGSKELPQAGEKGFVAVEEWHTLFRSHMLVGKCFSFLEIMCFTGCDNMQIQGCAHTQLEKDLVTGITIFLAIYTDSGDMKMRKLTLQATQSNFSIVCYNQHKSQKRRPSALT